MEILWAIWILALRDGFIKKVLERCLHKRAPSSTCSTLPNYSRDFEIKPTKNSRFTNVIISFFLIGLVTAFAIIKIPQFVDYSCNS